MGKMIKPLVVILLLLSIAALVLGCILFNKRELLKGRTQRLELGVGEIATAIHYPEFTEPSADFNPQTLVVAEAQFLDRMNEPLRKVKVAGELLYDTLQDTKADLARTIEELNDTKDKLARTEAELEQTKQTVKRLEGELDEARMEIAQLRNTISALEDDKRSLQATIDDLNNQLAEAAERERDLEDKNKTLEKALSDCEKIAYPDGTFRLPPRGLKGHIVSVNAFWNFVVVDIGATNGVVPTLEFLVHRDDKLIGKVRVSNVKDGLSIAEIINDWEQSPIREGDDVLF